MGLRASIDFSQAQTERPENQSHAAAFVFDCNALDLRSHSDIAGHPCIATPFGYQTNLMVYNPGGYRFADYLKVGIPLDLICWTITIVAVHFAWGF